MLWQLAFLRHLKLDCAQPAEDGALDRERVLLPRKLWAKTGEGLQMPLSAADYQPALRGPMQATVLMHADIMEDGASDANCGPAR